MMSFRLPFCAVLLLFVFMAAPAARSEGFSSYCREWFHQLIGGEQPPDPSVPVDFFRRMTGRKGAFSMTEAERIAWQYFPKLVREIPELPGPLTLQTLEGSQAKVYRLPGPPGAELLKNSHAFAGAKEEIGFFCIRGQWFAVLSRDGHVTPPEPFASLLRRRGSLQVDLHTHPGQDKAASFPSFEDLHHLGSTHDKVLHIATPTGLLELRSNGGTDTFVALAHSRWLEWARKNSMVAKEGVSSWPAFERFLTEVFAMKRIPWSDAAAIDRILAERTRLHPER